MNLSAEELSELTERYRNEKNRDLIDYRRLVTALEQVFSDEVNPSQIIQSSQTQAVFSEEERAKMTESMQQLKTQIVSRRILLKPGFQDFDRSRCQHITQPQFLRVLKNLTLMPPSEEVFDLMVRKYCDRGNMKEINYFKFCKDVDRPEDMFP